MSVHQVKPQWSTRAVLATYELFQYLFGVRAFRVDGRSMQEAILPATDFLAVCYEVVVFPEGSWWLPTSTVADKAWGGSISLEASGEIPTLHILRPLDFFIWIPRQELAGVFEPIALLGVVEGNLPDSPPPSGKPAS